MHALIPAGGAGTRLWPLSRRANPKFLRDLTGAGESLIQSTVRRLSPVSESVTIVTGRAHEHAVAAQCGGVEIVAEPSPKDSMAAIGLAAAIVHRRHGDSVVGSFAADHAIADEAAFHDAVRAAIASAEDGYVATIGITPTEPSSAYGYIHAGPEQGAARLALAFEEKPGAETARQYLATGEYLWNAGMFVMRTGVLLGALAELQPRLHAGLTAIGDAWDTELRASVLDEVWPTLPALVIDRAIAEPLADDGLVTTVPASMGWSDVGDFAALSEISPSPAAVTVESPGTWVSASKPVVVAGVPDAVVIEMDDVIFVTTHEASGAKAASEQVPEELK
ncbi:mannose-1-phosphate guanylyltransferase [Ruaniaceae bacterium KH17]|nr:mannose-1-phosphate guanylyltransferase [Ruaniaceae bacterium KH17]